MTGPRERFKRIAGRRTAKILDAIRILGNTSNRDYYEWTEDELRTIFGTIEAELKATRRLYTKQLKAKFSLGANRPQGEGE